MKKIRLIIHIITGALIVLTITGIILLIVTDRNLIDTSYEIIAFSLAAGGIIIAVASQIDSYQNEKQAKKVLDKIETLNREHDADEKVDRNFQTKLDDLLEMNQKIYRKISKKPKKSKTR